jgi:hypothetical protein
MTQLELSVPVQDLFVDYALIYQDEIFPIREAVLGLHGVHFQNHLQKLSTPVRTNVPFEVTRDSVLVFVNYVNNSSSGTPQLSPSTVFDVLSLATFWQMFALESLCENFINENIRILLIPAVNFLNSDRYHADAVAVSIRENLSDLVTDECLRGLPINWLHKILHFPEEYESGPFQRIFDFAVKVYEEQGPTASLLFEGLDLRRLNWIQLRALTSFPNFVWSFVASSLHNTTLALLEDNAALRLRLTVVEKDLGELAVSQSRIVALHKSQQATLGQLEEKTIHSIIDLQRLLGSLENSSAKQADFDSQTRALEGLKTHIEMIQRDFATRLDMEKLRGNCGTKQDIEILSKETARKSELQELRSQLQAISGPIASMKKIIDSQSARFQGVDQALAKIHGTLAQKADVKQVMDIKQLRPQLQWLFGRSYDIAGRLTWFWNRDYPRAVIWYNTYEGARINQIRP